MLRFRRIKTAKTSVSTHANFQNHFSRKPPGQRGHLQRMTLSRPGRVAGAHGLIARWVWRNCAKLETTDRPTAATATIFRNSAPDFPTNRPSLKAGSNLLAGIQACDGAFAAPSPTAHNTRIAEDRRVSDFNGAGCASCFSVEFVAREPTDFAKSCVIRQRRSEPAQGVNIGRMALTEEFGDP